MRRCFAPVRRAGFDIGLSTGKLTKAMVEELLQLPPEATRRISSYATSGRCRGAAISTSPGVVRGSGMITPDGAQARHGGGRGLQEDSPRPLPDPRHDRMALGMTVCLQFSLE